MAKRKSKTTAEFKAPKRTQHRAKRQKSADERNQSEDEDQTLTPESENSHNALFSDKLNEHQPGQSTTGFPVDPCCSLEAKTSHDDNEELGKPPEVSHEIEPAAVTLQTPDTHTLSTPLNTEAINVDQLELDDEEREIQRNSDHQIPDAATESQMEEELGSSETSYEQMPEDTASADPLIQRKIRKRMGMCRFGERKKMLKGPQTRGNAFEGRQENEMGLVTNEHTLMMSNEKGVIESEAPVPSFSTCCSMENTPAQDEQEQCGGQYGSEPQILVKYMSRESVAHETDHTTPSHPDADDPNLPEQCDTECMEQSAAESNVREDIDESVDFADVCEDATDVSAQEEAVVEVLSEASASAFELANAFGEELVVGGNEIDVSISDHTSEQCVELMDVTAHETLRASPVTHETENKCESPHFTEGVTTITSERDTDCEDSSVLSVCFPAAPPAGDPQDVQWFTERVCVESDAHEPEPSSPSSLHSLTDSQLNNIPLSLEDLPISCDLEDASELVCGLMRDIASLNELLMDARRKIWQQGRKPPLHAHKYKHNANRY